MIGIDTNVLLRFVMADDPYQSRVAEYVLRDTCTQAEPGFVSLVVIAEFVWALENIYQLEKETIALTLELLLTMGTLRLQSADQVQSAVESMKAETLNFHDALIASLARANFCETTFTFDRKAARREGFTQLPLRPVRG